MELVAGALAQVAGQRLDRQVGLADQYTTGELGRHAAQVADDVVHLRPVQAPQRVLGTANAHAGDGGWASDRRVVAQEIVLHGGGYGVDAEAVHPRAGTRSA